ALSEILTAIDSPSAREGLVRLASGGKGLGHQQEICGLILARVRKPEELISQIVERVPEERKEYTYWATDPAPFVQQFWLPWPAPKRGSLRKTVPKDILAKPN